MRRRPFALTCLMLTAIPVALVGCTSFAGPTTTSASAPVTKEAGAAGAGLGAGEFAQFLIDGVVQGVSGNAGYDLLGDLLSGNGDVTAEATTEKLDQIQSQLAGITTRLDTIDTDLNTIKLQMVDVELSGRLEAMRGWNNKMITLYKQYFLPIAAAAKDVSVAKKNVAAGDSASCSATVTATATSTPTASCTGVSAAALTDALTALQRKKSEFDDAFRYDDPYTVLRDQHDELYPQDANIKSVLKLVGTQLELKGYATWMDSQRLSSWYPPYSDQEALTALLIFEHDKMNNDTAALKEHYEEYVAFHAVEVANLPTEILWGQVNVGDQMYVATGQQGTWLPILPDGEQRGPFKATDVVSQYPGWDLPTDLRLTALYDGTKSAVAAAGSTHLGSVYLKSGHADESQVTSLWGARWVWSKDTSSQTVTCGHRYYAADPRTYTQHHAAKMENSDAIHLQAQPGSIQDPIVVDTTNVLECDQWVLDTYNTPDYSASVILTRTLGSAEDPMAQRSTALPPRPTPTGTATTGS